MNTLFKKFGEQCPGMPIFIHRRYGKDIVLFQDIGDGDVSKNLWTMNYVYKSARNRAKYSTEFLIEENTEQLKIQIERNYKEVKKFYRDYMEKVAQNGSAEHIKIKK